MAKLIVVTRDGSEHEIEGNTNLSVMENIRDAGFDELLALCGGCCSCATCHVFVDDTSAGTLPPVSEDEDEQRSPQCAVAPVVPDSVYASAGRPARHDCARRLIGSTRTAH